MHRWKKRAHGDMKTREAIAIWSLMILLFFCKEDHGPLPVISQFEPVTGSTGTLVTITGKNFTEDAAHIAVQFSTLPAKISSASRTEITAFVPKGSVTGKIQVTVNGKTAISTDDFIVVDSAATGASNP